MKRLVVLIGVRQPGGGLGELKSIEKCLVDMRNWALRQNIPPTDIKIFTDIPGLIEPGDKTPLSLDHIFSWIDARAKEPEPADQLLIYFSGHGTLYGGAQVWLLPQAPGKIWEAINLTVSQELAVWSRFKHVVFIGDSCASVIGNAEFNRVEGTAIFENTPDELRTAQQIVDVLLAALPGNTSLEIAIDGVSVSPYTVQLLEALGGTPTSILEPQTPDAKEPLVLRARKLAAELRTSVNKFLRTHNIKPPGPPRDTVVSTKEWVALFSPLGLPPQPPIAVPHPPAQPPVSPDSMQFVLGSAARSSAVTSSPLSADPMDQRYSALATEFNRKLQRIASGSLIEIPRAWSSEISDGYRFEMKCGFVVTGSPVSSATSRPSVPCSLMNEREVFINIEDMELVLIQFGNLEGILVPALPNQIGFVHVEDGQVVSIAYEPSGYVDIFQRNVLGTTFHVGSQRIRNFRDLLLDLVTGGDLNFTRVGRKRLAGVLKAIPYGEKFDFSTLLYLAYIVYISKFPEPALSTTARLMQDQFGFVPFDLKILLALARIKPEPALHFGMPFPLLTLGWSLLKATHEQLPDGLTELCKHHRNSAWTRLDSVGVELCQAYLSSQTASGSSSQGGIAAALGTIAGLRMKFEKPTAWAGQVAELPIHNRLQPASYEDDEDLGFTMTDG